MKYLVKIFVITYLIFGINNSFAEDKIVYVDMNKILTESKVGIFVEKELTEIHKGNLDNFKKIEEKLKKQEIDLISKRNVMSIEEFNKKTESLRNEAAKYQNERREKFEMITNKRNNARGEVLKVLDPILTEYFEQNNISLLLYKNTIAIGTTELDITKAIIDELNKKLPSIKIN